MNKIILFLLLITTFYVPTYTHEQVYKTYTIKITIVPILDYDPIQWQKIAVATKSLINLYNNGPSLETNGQNFIKDLTLLDHTLQNIASLIAQDTTYTFDIMTFNKEETPLTDEQIPSIPMIEITLLFKIFRNTTDTHKNNIDMLMADFSTHKTLLPLDKKIEALYQTTTSIMQSLTGNAHIYISLFEQPLK